jgi:hypothetical protein
VRKRLEISEYTITTTAAPVQVEGTLVDGREFYVRSRHRTITLGVGATLEEAVGTDVLRLELVAGGDDHALSTMDEEDAVALTRLLINVLDGVEGYADRVARGDVHPWHRSRSTNG